MPWTTPQTRPVGYVIKKAEDWDVVINDLQYLKNILDNVEAQAVVLGGNFTVRPGRTARPFHIETGWPGTNDVTIAAPWNLFLAAASNAHLSSNAYYDGTAWQRMDTTVNSGIALARRDGISFSVWGVPAGTGPITWNAGLDVYPSGLVGVQNGLTVSGQATFNGAVTANQNITLASGKFIDIPGGGGGGGIGAPDLGRTFWFPNNATYGSVVLSIHSWGYAPMFTIRDGLNLSTVWFRVESDGRLSGRGVTDGVWYSTADTEVALTGVSTPNNVGPSVAISLFRQSWVTVTATGVYRSTGGANTNVFIWVYVDGAVARGHRFWASGANDNHSFSIVWSGTLSAGNHTVTLYFQADTAGFGSAIGQREIVVHAVDQVA